MFSQSGEHGEWGQIARLLNIQHFVFMPPLASMLFFSLYDSITPKSKNKHTHPETAKMELFLDPEIGKKLQLIAQSMIRFKCKLNHSKKY